MHRIGLIITDATWASTPPATTDAGMTANLHHERAPRTRTWTFSGKNAAGISGRTRRSTACLQDRESNRTSAWDGASPAEAGRRN